MWHHHKCNTKHQPEVDILCGIMMHHVIPYRTGEIDFLCGILMNVIPNTNQRGYYSIWHHDECNTKHQSEVDILCGIMMHHVIPYKTGEIDFLCGIMMNAIPNTNQRG